MPYKGESFVIGNLVSRIYFAISYGQRISQFIYVTLICWTANNAMFLLFKVYVGQWLTKVTFYSVLESKYHLISFKTWICLLNICFLFCDGVCCTPSKVLLMFFFFSIHFVWGISTKFWLKFQPSPARHNNWRKVLCTWKLLSECQSSFLMVL